MGRCQSGGRARYASLVLCRQHFGPVSFKVIKFTVLPHTEASFPKGWLCDIRLTGFVGSPLHNLETRVAKKLAFQEPKFKPQLGRLPAGCEC